MGSRREECSGRQRENDQQQLANRLQEIQLAIDTEREHDRGLEVFLAGDFNHHDSLWGGDRVASEHRQGEAEGLLDFIENTTAYAAGGCNIGERWNSGLNNQPSLCNRNTIRRQDLMPTRGPQL